MNESEEVVHESREQINVTHAQDIREFQQMEPSRGAFSTDGHQHFLGTIQKMKMQNARHVTNSPPIDRRGNFILLAIQF